MFVDSILQFYVEVQKSALTGIGDGSGAGAGRWDVNKSLFVGRRKEADSRSLYDSSQLYAKMLERDWKRIRAKERFMNVLYKRVPFDDAERYFELLRDVMRKNYRVGARTWARERTACT